MPENVLDQQNEGETNVDNVVKSKAEFDPEKESYLRELSLQKENEGAVLTEGNALDPEPQEDIQSIEQVEEVKPVEPPLTQTSSEKDEVLQDLSALDTAKDIQTNIERSKVAEVNAQSFIAELDEATQKAWSEANNELNRISLHRSVVESEFQSALKNFDIAKATQLEKKINELSKLYTKKQAEANLVNLKLNEQLSSAFTKWKKWTAEFLNSIKNEDGYKKAYYIMEKIKSMDKEKARSLLDEPEIVAHLGSWIGPVKDYVERIES